MERIDKIVTGVVVASYCTAPGPSGIINAHWVRNPRSNTIYPPPVDLTGRPLELDVYYPTQWNLQVLAAAASSSGANRRIFLLMWTAPAGLAFNSDSDGHVSAGLFQLRCQWNPVAVHEVHCMRLQAFRPLRRSRNLLFESSTGIHCENETGYETYDTRTQSFSVSARSCSGDGRIGSTVQNSFMFMSR